MYNATKVMKKLNAMGYYTFLRIQQGGTEVVHLSAEEGDDAADYYGEYRGGCPWINPKLIEFAKRIDCY